MDVDVVEDEPSVIEYARSNGICVDYTTETPQIGDISVPSYVYYDQDLKDPSDGFFTNAISGLIKERLTINKDAALLLKAVHSWQEPLATDQLAKDERRRKLNLKQELPILRSDYELDLLTYGSAIVPNLRDLRIPSEVTNEENDEGFEWPAKYFAYPAQCEEKVRAEKMAVSREALVYLQDAIRNEYTARDAEVAEAESATYKLNAAILPLTPPLLPLSPALTPYIPSSPANRVDLTSDTSDSVAIESMALERQIMAADSLARKSSDSSDSMLLDITHSPQSSPLCKDQPSLNLKRTAEELKVEGPLTPSMFSTSPMKKLKSVSFSATLPELIPYAPWTNESSDKDNDSSIDFDEIFKDIEPLAKELKANVENEQLLGADTTARVDIPDVDFILPVAPWNEYSQSKSGKKRPGETELDGQMKFLLRTKREDLQTATSWHGLSALERDLQWSILTTRISSVNLVENLHGEKELDRMLNKVTTCDVTTSSSQVWKREGLRILDDGGDEEELGRAEEEEGRDMDILIRKRKFDLEDEAAEMVRKRIVSEEVVNTQLRQPHPVLESKSWKEVSTKQQVPPHARLRALTYHQQRPHAPAPRDNTKQPPIDDGSELMFGGFSAITALHKFMETRGKNVQPIGSGTGKQGLPNHTSLMVHSRQHSSSPSPRGERNAHIGSQVVGVKEEPSLCLLPDAPVIPKSILPCSFIASSPLLQQRSLMKQIELLFPSAEIVYRDYSSPHSAAKEADILLSPSTGLIFTTLQQVKQRALPGQPDRSPVKELMAILQLRYERLVVMVSEGFSREMEAFGSSRPEDSRDKAVLSTLSAFASQLEGEVLVKYVPGGEQAFAHSIVMEMTKYGLPHGSSDIGDIKPLVVETNWEVFLRRAGLNAFAAQVLVASLKQPFDVPLPLSSDSSSLSRKPNTISVSGLPAFLMIGEEERVMYFQALMGGSRILRRVSRALDQEWVSAAHGFRLR
ncbi:Nn.00g115710.m01.CDS01 [Neocucurbitaria sp. VM-36]